MSRTRPTIKNRHQINGDYLQMRDNSIAAYHHGFNQRFRDQINMRRQRMNGGNQIQQMNGGNQIQQMNGENQIQQMNEELMRQEINETNSIEEAVMKQQLNKLKKTHAILNKYVIIKEKIKTYMENNLNSIKFTKIYNNGEQTRDLLKYLINNKNQNYIEKNNNEDITKLRKFDEINGTVSASKSGTTSVDNDVIHRVQFNLLDPVNYVTNYITLLMSIINEENGEFPLCQEKILSNIFNSKQLDIQSMKNFLHKDNISLMWDSVYYPSLQSYVYEIGTRKIIIDFIESAVEILILLTNEGKTVDTLDKVVKGNFFDKTCDFFYCYMYYRGYINMGDSNNGRQNEWFIHHIFPFITDMLLLYISYGISLNSTKNNFIDIAEDYLNSVQRINTYQFVCDQDFCFEVNDRYGRKQYNPYEYKSKHQTSVNYMHINEFIKYFYPERNMEVENGSVNFLLKILNSGGTGYIFIENDPYTNEILKQCNHDINCYYTKLFPKVKLLLRNIPSYSEILASGKNIYKEDGGDLISIYNSNIYIIDSKNNKKEKNDDDWIKKTLNNHGIQLLCYCMNYFPILIPENYKDNIINNCFILFLNPSLGQMVYMNIHNFINNLDKKIKNQRYKLTAKGMEIFDYLRQGEFPHIWIRKYDIIEGEEEEEEEEEIDDDSSSDWEEENTDEMELE
jgi:hypothetical protein